MNYDQSNIPSVTSTTPRYDPLPDTILPHYDSSPVRPHTATLYRTTSATTLNYDSYPE